MWKCSRCHFWKGQSLEKRVFFSVDLQSNVHVWKGLSRQTIHRPFSSVCLCVHCMQLDAFVCLIHKTPKSKIVIMLFISLCCQVYSNKPQHYHQLQLHRSVSTLLPQTHTTPSPRLQPSLPLWDSPPPQLPIILPSSSAAVTDGFIPQHINNASSRWMKLYNT